MRKKIWIKIFSLSILAVFLISNNTLAESTENLTANQVMEKVDQRYDGDSANADMTMILINRKKNQRIRKLKSYSKDYGEDTKGIIFFQSPADVRNTAYLSWNWDEEDREDDSWLYLPALRKVKRIASGDQSGAFMGSDFSYSDINGIEIKNWDYEFIKNTETVEGHETWVIKGTPKESKKKKVIKETGYLKSRVWVRKDNFMVIRAKYWVKKGRKIKYFRAKDIRKKDDVWTIFEMTMVTTKSGKKEHSSVIKIHDIVYNKGVSDTMFTTQRMERGL